MRTFWDLTHNERRQAIIAAVKSLVHNIALHRVEFENKTPAGKSANRLIALVLTESNTAGHDLASLKLNLAKNLKSYIYPIAIAAAEQKLYSGNREIKELT